jgi:imidazolonepropionase-like amidohydrolase
MFKFVKTKSIIDGTGSPAVQKGCMLIRGGVIEEIGDAQQFPQVPSDAEIIDLSNHHVMPGLINAHTHLSLVPGEGNQPAQKRQPPGINVLRSTPNLLKDIRSGVTTSRIMGEENFIDIDFKNAITRGLINGPRLVVAGIGIAASHSHGVGLRPTDGKEEMRKHARQNLAQGADFIKILATGGVSSAGKALHTCPYTREEIAVAVEEATRAETYVAAHAHGGSGLDFCIEEGVRTIEHGAFINEAQLEKIIKRDLWIVGTLSILFHPTGIEKSDFQVPLIKEKVLKARDAAAETFTTIVKSAANLAMGTDAMHGLLGFELEKLVEFGATNMQAILCVTKHAAAVCRIEDKVGTLEPGKLADFIALPGDPLADIRSLRTVDAVYKEGILFQGI